jgi:hypothetical protein
LINNNLYKIRIYKNWSGKTCYFQNVDDEKIVGLYINEHDTRPLDILFELLMEELKARGIKTCLD